MSNRIVILIAFLLPLCAFLNAGCDSKGGEDAGGSNSSVTLPYTGIWEQNPRPRPGAGFVIDFNPRTYPKKKDDEKRIKITLMGAGGGGRYFYVNSIHKQGDKFLVDCKWKACGNFNESVLIITPLSEKKFMATLRGGGAAGFVDIIFTPWD